MMSDGQTDSCEGAVFHNIPAEVHKWAVKTFASLAFVIGLLSALYGIGRHIGAFSGSSGRQFLIAIALIGGPITLFTLTGLLAPRTRSDEVTVSPDGVAISGDLYEWGTIAAVSIEDGILILTDSSGDKPITYRFSVTCMDHEGIAEAINRFQPAAS